MQFQFLLSFPSLYYPTPPYHYKQKTKKIQTLYTPPPNPFHIKFANPVGSATSPTVVTAVVIAVVIVGVGVGVGFVLVLLLPL